MNPTISNSRYLTLYIYLSEYLQDKAICQDEWRFAMGNRDRSVAEYKELMKNAVSES
jgi:hypothetical protein